MQIRQTRGSRSGRASTEWSSSWPGSERRKTAPTNAAARHATARPSKAACRLMWLVSAGRASAATAPPSGTAICLMPRARPRSSAPNHAMTARPLAALTPAPTPPATASAAMSSGYDDAYAAQKSAAAAPVWPTAITARSPIRSATMPHRRSVATEPKLTAASTTPTWVSVRSNSLRIAGAIAGNPRRIAELAACANTPAARIVQRYLRSGGAVVELTKLADLLGVRALAVLAGNLEHGRQSLQPRMREEDSQPFPDQPVADVVVPVAVRAERRLGVVGVQCTQAIQADAVVEVGEQGVEDNGIGDVDARHEQMAGI